MWVTLVTSRWDGSHSEPKWATAHRDDAVGSRSLNSQTKNIFIKKRQLLTTQLASAYANAGQYCHGTEWGGERTRWELAGVKFMCLLPPICLWKCQRPWLVPHVSPLINSSLIYLFIFLGSIYCQLYFWFFFLPRVLLRHVNGWQLSSINHMPWPLCPSPLLLRTRVRVSG